ncbi:permease [Sphingomonas sp. ASY06-1R]|uniref:permease n=1 Tax=Sphingomonas sp. ASY06-1R TaxID=3445771 RepID=UPI003FA1BC0E
MADAAPSPRPPRSLLALYLLLGFSAGLPFYMFNAVLTLRLARHGIDIVLIGFFAWVALLPTFKFVWAPLLDRFDVPGFGRFWGKRRGWIMLSQLGIFLSMTAMAFTSSDRSLPLTALFAVLLAFWTTTLEVAADGWRIELAPTKAEQGPMVAANLWGYRSAMVAAGSGAVFVAGQLDWTWAYLVIALAAFLPFPILVATARDAEHDGRRGPALVTGLIASAIILLGSLLVTAIVGWALLAAAAKAGVTSKTNVTPLVLALALLPFVGLAIALPRIRRMRADAPARLSAAIGPYVDIFWRFGYATLPVLAFVSFYRMGDVMTLTLSHPLWNARGYSLNQIAMADGAVALLASMVGVAIGGWMAARWRMGAALAGGAIASAFGNWIFVWLWYASPSNFVLYVAAGFDQFAHGLEGAVFVVYLSMLVNPRYPGAQYAFLSGFAFLLPRLLAGAAGSIQQAIGYDGFFWLSGGLSAAAILFLPFITGVKPRSAEA